MELKTALRNKFGIESSNEFMVALLDAKESPAKVKCCIAEEICVWGGLQLASVYKHIYTTLRHEDVIHTCVVPEQNVMGAPVLNREAVVQEVHVDPPRQEAHSFGERI